MVHQKVLNPLSKFFNRYNKNTRLVISFSILSLIFFLTVTSAAPFQDQLFSRLYPKPKSHAQIASPSIARFATAGQAQAELNNLFYYNWNMPPTQSQISPVHNFAWMVGKLDRSDGLSCGSLENPCSQVDPVTNKNGITRIYDAEAPGIISLLNNPINKGGVWIIGNEANFYPVQSAVQYPDNWHSHIDAGLHAEQYKMYRALIKGLDPTAKIAHSGLLYDNRKGSVPYVRNPNDPDDPITYLDTFLNDLSQSEYPDIYNVHYYPDPGKDGNNNVVQARTFKNFVATRDSGKPVWVTEFGMIDAGATSSETINYMDTMIGAFTAENLADRWFWFIGSSEPGWTQTALTGNGQLTAIGQHYLDLLKSTLKGNDAQFISQTCPPSPMTSGQSAAVVVAMKNTGSATWTAAGNYRLGSQNPQDNLTWGIGRILLNSIVSLGGIYTFNFNVTAPATPRTYNFQWKMVQDRVEWFGDYTPNCTVNVVIPTPTGGGCNSDAQCGTGQVCRGGYCVLAPTPTPRSASIGACDHPAPPPGCHYEGQDIYPACGAQLVCDESSNKLNINTSVQIPDKIQL